MKLIQFPVERTSKAKQEKLERLYQAGLKLAVASQLDPEYMRQALADMHSEMEGLGFQVPSTPIDG